MRGTGFSGHLFHGRYKALVTDPEAADYALTVADYIHLNPVRAGISATEPELAVWPWSSYRDYIRPSDLPAWMDRETVCGAVNPELASHRRQWRRRMAARIRGELAAGRPDAGGKDAPSRWALGASAKTIACATCADKASFSLAV